MTTHTRVFSRDGIARLSVRKDCSTLKSHPPPLPNHSPWWLTMTSSNGRTPVGQSDDGPKPPAEGAHHAHNSIPHKSGTPTHLGETTPHGVALKCAAPNLPSHLVAHKTAHPGIPLQRGPNSCGSRDDDVLGLSGSCQTWAWFCSSPTCCTRLPGRTWKGSALAAPSTRLTTHH